MRKFVTVLITILFLNNYIFCRNVFTYEKSLSKQNIVRSIELADIAFATYFTGKDMTMARFYIPQTNKRSEEKGSIWMYTSAIEATNAILHTLKLRKTSGENVLYNQYFNKYEQVLHELYENADYYLGSFNLTSYTQTAEWTVYGVHRGNSKGKAKVEGVENVYDDQMWLIRELLESYKLTNNLNFLEKAEYLTAYVLDGWDCTFDAAGNERGGITWGPGYVSKHACSNAPLISPLVWLYEIYKNKNDIISHRYIDFADKKTRKEQQIKKSEYYLSFAKKIYDWQKNNLLRADGVYDDMMGGCTHKKPQMEIIEGVEYKTGIECLDRVGPAITYNSGTMLSGAADLYRVTGEKKYYTDAVNLADAGFVYFANKDSEIPGYYSYSISGFGNWFNGVLLRGFLDIYPYYKNVAPYINSFQQNLDYGFDNFLYKGFLPSNLLTGWNQNENNNQIEGMFSFTFISEYALLSQYELNNWYEKSKNR